MIKTESKRQCIICGQYEEFIDIDYLRLKPAQSKICVKCGFIFSDKFYDETEYEVYLEKKSKDTTIHTGHLISANRKIGILEVTLGEYLKEEKDLKICDLGAGIGYLLRWARDKYGHKQISGVEFDIKLRRFTKNLFNINLVKDFDEAKTYDLICMNHLLEHTLDPIKELDKLKKTLTEKGKIYVSTSIWMNNLNLSASGGSEFDNYFPEDTMNCWTKEQFKYLINKAGWKIEKEFDVGGFTCILTPLSPLKEITRINPLTLSKNGKEIEIELVDIKRAIGAYSKTNFREAIRLYPKFVDAYVGEVGMNQGKFDLQLRILDAGLGICPGSNFLKMNKALLLFQYGKLEDAQRIFLDCLNKNPHDENVLFQIAMIHMKYGDKCYAEGRNDEGKKNWQECLKLFETVLNINPTHYQEIYNFIGNIYSGRVLNGEEIKDESSKFEAPKGKNAPDIDLGIK